MTKQQITNFLEWMLKNNKDPFLTYGEHEEVADEYLSSQPLSSNQQQSAEEILIKHKHYVIAYADEGKSNIIHAMEEYATLRCQALESEIGKHMENNAAMSNQIATLTARLQASEDKVKEYEAQLRRIRDISTSALTKFKTDNK